MSTADHFDALIVGSGIMGAAVARCLREAAPDLRIGMIAGGPRIGPRAGQHLHDIADPAVREQYTAKVSSGIQAFYTGVGPTDGVGPTMTDVSPGMYHLVSIGEDAAEMPGASVAWNAGGMGVHWTAATPIPFGSEVTPFLSPEEWDADLARARELLRVNTQPYPQTAAGTTVARLLGEHFDGRSAPGREVQDMPMAINEAPNGRKERTSPSVIFPALADPTSDPAFHLVADAMVVELLHDGGRVTGAVVRDIHTGDTFTVTADQVVVCADTVRTPQLLFASGIRPEALGRYLNEHYFLTGHVDADIERLGLDLDGMRPPTEEEWVSDCLWVPHSGPAQPYQVHIMTKVVVDEERRPVGYGVGIEYYVMTQTQRENRLEFSDTERDATGMPRIRTHFRYTDEDRAALERARIDQAAAARLIGEFDPETAAAVLTPGSSLHLTGTVRMGPADDGTSVCDTDCRVWGYENLYVAGNGVIPTALVCNSTLTATITAVRAARAVLAATAPVMV